MQHNDESIIVETHLFAEFKHQTGEAYSRIGLTTTLYAVALSDAEHENSVWHREFSKRDALAARCFHVITPFELRVINNENS